MITFYFIRHGETVWNKSGRYQGSTDVSLSDLGYKQAALTKERLKDIHLDSVISSPLDRAVKTAEGIAESHNLELEKNDLLQELHFGDWEGLTFEEIENKWSGMIDKMYRHPDNLRLPNGETFSDMQKRTMTAMKDIISRGDDKTYAVVSHGAAIRSIICGFLDIPLEKSWNFSVHNASITCMTHYIGDRTILTFHNSTEHLNNIKHDD